MVVPLTQLTKLCAALATEWPPESGGLETRPDQIPSDAVPATGAEQDGWEGGLSIQATGEIDDLTTPPPLNHPPSLNDVCSF